MNRILNKQTDDQAGLQQELELPETLGFRLRRAREALGISAEDIADQLCLNYSVIHAIESDRYFENENTVFTRGYIRAYARLVNISLEEIQKVFIELGLIASSEIPEVSIKFETPQNAKEKNKIIKWISCAIVGFLVVMVFTWWYLSR